MPYTPEKFSYQNVLRNCFNKIKFPNICVCMKRLEHLINKIKCPFVYCTNLMSVNIDFLQVNTFSINCIVGIGKDEAMLSGLAKRMSTCSRKTKDKFFLAQQLKLSTKPYGTKNSNTAFLYFREIQCFFFAFMMLVVQ